MKKKIGKFILPLFLTSSLLINCTSMSKLMEYRRREFAIQDCLEKAWRIEYVNDKRGFDYWQTPIETRRRKKGDCEDKSNYLNYLLSKEGIKSQSVCGKINLSDKKGHVWVELYKDGELYILDPNFDSGWIFEKKKNLDSSLYIHCEGDYVLNKFEDYIRRSGLNGNDVNAHYNHLIKQREFFKPYDSIFNP